MTTRPVMSIAGAKSALDTLTALLGAAATLKIYSGAQPTATTDAEGGTLGATLTFGNPAFGASTNATSNGKATATANAIGSETNAPNAITAGHFRIASSAPTVIFQGNVGTSGADLNLNTTTIGAGDTISITSFKITLDCGDGAS